MWLFWRIKAIWTLKYFGNDHFKAHCLLTQLTMKFILPLSFFVNQLFCKSTHKFHNVINNSNEQEERTDANSEQHKITKRNAVHRVEHVFNANGITHLNNCSYPDHYCNPTSPSLIKKVDTSINGPLGKPSSKITFGNLETF